MDGKENAGTITAYDTEAGKLTISLFGGDTVSGIVTENTRIRCGQESDHSQDDDQNDDPEPRPRATARTIRPLRPGR